MAPLGLLWWAIVRPRLRGWALALGAELVDVGVVLLELGDRLVGWGAPAAPPGMIERMEVDLEHRIGAERAARDEG